MSTGLAVLTLLHVVISLIGIVTFGLLRSECRRLILSRPRARSRLS